MANPKDYLKQVEQTSLYTGKLLQIIQRKIEYSKNGEVGHFNAEIALRPPGVRCMVVMNDSILLTKELRHELGAYDFRLPGGKVFDTINDYLPFVDADIKRNVEDAVIKELIEETGIIAHKIRHIHTSQCGASIIWDLHYYEISQFEYNEGGAENESGEIIYPEWKTFQEVEQMCLNGQISEDRTVAVLLKYLSQRKG